MFGGLRLERDGHEVDLGRPRQRFVLTVLAIEADHVVATDRLTDLLWGTDGEKERASLHAYVSNLRRVLEPDRDRTAPSSMLVRQGPGYRLAVDRAAVDALRFEDLVDRGVATRDLAALDEAISLWADPLPEHATEPVVVDAIARWRGLLGAAVETAADLRLQAGDALGAAQLLEPHLAAFPLRERMAALAALALYRTGRQADALRVIDRARSTLAETAGLDAGAELTSLERRILDHAPDLAPAPVAPTSSSLFGRDDELAVLLGATARLTERRGGIVTVTGPSGIGKTALVEELTVALDRAGTRVAWARCPEGAAPPPFWPLTKLGLLDVDTDKVTAADPFTHAQHIARQVGGSTAPRVLVIDDLQWADTDTLRVLTHLAGELRQTSTLLVTTSRALAADATADLVACVAQLARQRVADVALTELSEGDIALWLGTRSELAGAIHTRAGGNPFFVREVIELISDGDLSRVASVPPGVQAVVRRRISQLPPRTQKALRVASLLGARFETDVVAEALAVTAGALGQDLVPAIDASLVIADGTGELRFAHAIVAEALAAEINAVDRAGIHAMLARAILRWHADDAHSASVALHAAAGATVEPGFAAAAARRAARVASARAAYSEAARHWAVAAEMTERSDPLDLSGRVEALVALAHAYERADEMRDARVAVVTAIDLARGLEDWRSVGVAAAALNHASIWPNQPYPAVDLELVALLEDALAAMPTVDAPERVFTLGALGTELMHSVDGAHRSKVSTEAVDIARRLGDPALLAKALHARTFSLKQPDAVPERKEVAVEIAALAEDDDLGADIALLGELQVALADLALGDLPAVAERLPRCVALLDQPVGLALRSQVGYFRALVEVMRGRYGEAIARAGEVHELFRRTRPAEAEVFSFAQRLTIGHDLGDLSEDDLLAPTRPGAIGFALALQLYSAVILFDLDRRDEATARVPYRRGELPERPLDYVTVFIDAAAAHVAAEIGDAAAVPALLERLSPMAGRWANAGTGAGSLGLVDLAIARLHATAGADEDARAWFARAVENHERIGAPAWLARSLLHQGVFLGADGGDALDRACLTRRRLRVAHRRGTSRASPPLTTGGRPAPRNRQGGVQGGRRTVGPWTTTSQPSRTRPPTSRATSGCTVRSARVPPSSPRRPPGPSDAQTRKARVRWFEGFAAEIQCHHHIEDELLFPAIAARVATYPEIAPKLEADHAELDELLDDLKAALASTDTTRAAVLAAALRDHLDEHLGFEDAEVAPLFVRHFTAEEYADLDARAVKMTPFKQLLFTAPWLISHLDEAERDHLLASVPKPLTLLWIATRRRYGRLAARALA